MWTNTLQIIRCAAQKYPIDFGKLVRGRVEAAVNSAPVKKAA